MSERIFTLITGHGKLDFVRTDDGTLVLKSVNDRPLSKMKKIREVGLEDKK